MYYWFLHRRISLLELITLSIFLSFTGYFFSLILFFLFLFFFSLSLLYPSPVRVILGLIVTSTFLSYTRAIRTTLGPLVSRFLCVVTIVQFHFLFYSSRPLPNTFALAMVLVALRFCLLKQYPLFIWMAGASIILFR